MSYRMNYSQVAETGNFEPLPDGVYSVEIEKYEETETSKGKPMIKVRYRIVSEKHKNRKLFDQIVLFGPEDKGAGMTKHFLHIIGEPHEGEFEVNPENWIGKKLMARIVIDTKYNNNKVVGREVIDDIPF